MKFKVNTGKKTFKSNKTLIVKTKKPLTFEKKVQNVIKKYAEKKRNVLCF